MLSKFAQKGFSLVELMVVITIIAIISTVAISSISELQKSGRDTQRQADINNIQLALQQYYANENHFPDSLNLTTGGAITNCTGKTVTVPACSVVRTYSAKTPVDPSGTSYCYLSLTSISSSSTSNNCVSGQATSGKCNFYKLFAKLESPPGDAGSYSCNNVNGYNFAVTPL